MVLLLKPTHTPLSTQVYGPLPGSALTTFTQLQALSLVDTQVHVHVSQSSSNGVFVKVTTDCEFSQITGSLPVDLGDIETLSMIWLDHNPSLGGLVPASLSKLNLTVVEFHRSNFSGVLPELSWHLIPDCTLAGMGTPFDCPLPEGAETYCGAQCE